MRVFVTGASGGIGTAVVADLAAAGHEVLGLARSASSAAKVEAAGGTAVLGAITDLDVLADSAGQVDGAIHLAFSNDFGNLEQGIAEERAAVEAVSGVLQGTGKPFVYAGGTPFVEGRVATEQDPNTTTGPVGGRGVTANIVLDLAGKDVRSSVVGLPRSVHQLGHGLGFGGILVNAALQSGASVYVGDGEQRWPAVHRLDAARLFRLALEKAEPGTKLHAVGEEGDTMRDLAEAIGTNLGLPVQQVDAATFGPLGQVFVRDQPASSAWTREHLGWTPTHPGLLEELRTGDLRAQ